MTDKGPEDKLNLNLNPDGGLTTLVDLRISLGGGPDSAIEGLPGLLSDPNELRLGRMLSQDHAVYGVPTPFVGRREALETIYNSVRDTVNLNELRTVEVVGRQGCGKTRLIAEMFGIIDPRKRGMRILAASCSESETVDGLGIFAQLLRARFKLHPGDKEAVPKIEKEIQPLVQPRLLPTAARLLAYMAGLQPTSSSTLELYGDFERFHRRAVKTFFNLLRYDISQAPHVLAFHRVEHLTPGAIKILEELVQELRSVPLMLIFLGVDPPPDSLIARRHGHVKVELEPLEPSQVRHLVRRILHKVEDLPEALVEDLIARSSGIPGLVEDNIRLIIQRGGIITGKDKWKVNLSRLGGLERLAASVEEASKARVACLSDEMGKLLEMASAFGPVFWLSGMLSLLHGLPRDEDDSLVPWVDGRFERQLDETLKEARRQDLVVGHPHAAIPGETEYSFAHRGDRARLYRALKEDERERYHRMIGQWLTGRRFQDARAWSEVIATHLELGGRSERATEYYLDAAQAAQEAYDLGRAREMYRRALSLVDVDRADLLVRVLEGLGDTTYAYADFPNARRIYGALLEGSCVATDKKTGARAWLKLGKTHRALGDYPRARPCFGHALRLYRELDDSGGIADALDEISYQVWLKGGAGAYDEALEYLKRSIEMRRVFGDSGATASTLQNMAQIQLAKGDTRAADDGFNEVLSLRRRDGDRAGEARALIGVGSVKFAQQDHQAAREAWKKGLELAEMVGARDTIGTLLNSLGELHLELKEHARAAELLDEAREVTAETGDQRTSADVTRNLAYLALARDRWGDALKLAEEAIGTCRAIESGPALARALRTKGEVLGNQLFVSAEDGEEGTEDAISCFEEAGRLFEEAGDDLELARTLRAHAKYLTERGKEAEAEVLEVKAMGLGF